MVGLGLPDGAEREQLRAKWAEFSDNIASYVVRSSALFGRETKLCEVTVKSRPCMNGLVHADYTGLRMRLYGCLYVVCSGHLPPWSCLQPSTATYHHRQRASVPTSSSQCLSSRRPKRHAGHVLMQLF